MALRLVTFGQTESGFLMHNTDHLEIKDHSSAVDSARTPTDGARVRGEALVAHMKGLLHEGNVRRISVQNAEGKTIIEIPVTAGVVAAIVAPALTAIAAVGALASDWQIDVLGEKTPVG